MLWALFAAMSLIAVAFVILPLTRDLPRQMSVSVLAIIAIAILAGGLYYTKGSPDVPSGASQAPNVSQIVAFGVAMVEDNDQQFSAEAIAVFENALAIDSNHPEALFWGGIAAYQSGNSALAADRWEMLLATNPPAAVRNTLIERIADWRGEPVPERAPEVSTRVVSASVSLSAAARNELPGEATVFVIARDPAQPSPPIAVARRNLSELPATIELGDRESMIPGRNLSDFEEFEIIARVSVSGSPAAQTGDWFVTAIVRPADSSQVELAISERVQ